MERYLPEDIVLEYETIEDIKKRYNLYSDTIDEYVIPLEVGGGTEFNYDNYIDLMVEMF